MLRGVSVKCGAFNNNSASFSWLVRLKKYMRDVIDMFANKVSSGLDRFFMAFHVCFSCRLFGAGGSRRDCGLYMYSWLRSCNCVSWDT